MKSMSRVHIHSHKEPNGRAYIVGERSGLRSLAKALEKAANGAVGMETITLYSSDGHPYELMIVTDITEQEWQNTEVPYKRNSDPSQFESVKIYDSLKSEIIKQ